MAAAHLVAKTLGLILSAGVAVVADRLGAHHNKSHASYDKGGFLHRHSVTSLETLH
jgi:hypothetical protein